MFKIKSITRKFDIPTLRVGEHVNEIEYISFSAFLKADNSNKYIRWIFSTKTGKWGSPITITENQYLRAKSILKS
jgi:hypothetical protein